jgi:hypothetical protein
MARSLLVAPVADHVGIGAGIGIGAGGRPAMVNPAYEFLG